MLVVGKAPRLAPEKVLAVARARWHIENTVRASRETKSPPKAGQQLLSYTPGPSPNATGGAPPLFMQNSWRQRLGDGRQMAHAGGIFVTR